MGKGNSKEDKPPEGPLVEDMKRKFGLISVSCLREWEKLGFPEGGSLSKAQITKLKDKLRDRERELKKGKKVKVSAIELIDRHKACLKFWEEEVENRERRKLQSQIKNVKVGDAEEKKEIKQKPSNPFTARLYPSLTGTEDPFLDCPPPQRPPASSHPPPQQSPPSSSPPPYDSAAGAAPTTLQQQSPITSAPVEVAVPDSTEDARAETDNSIQGAGGTSSYHTPIACRTRAAYGEIYTAPMVQVMGNDGVALVFRPWSIKDMQDNLSHLPDITCDGERFAADLAVFCQQFMPTFPEINRLLMMKIGPIHHAVLNTELQPQHHLRHHEWEHADNQTYRTALTALCNRIKDKFPRKVDMCKITSCKQGQEEGVIEYYHRLHKVFKDNSGLSEPDAPGVNMTIWEIHLSAAFRNGLRPDIAAAVNKSCVGVAEARLEEVRRHAVHAHDCFQAAKEKDDKNKRDVKHKALLTMAQMVAPAPQGGRPPHHAHHPRGRGGFRGRRGGPNFQSNSGRCFICQEEGHWARDCPRRGSGHPGRGAYGPPQRGRGFGHHGEHQGRDSHGFQDRNSAGD